MTKSNEQTLILNLRDNNTPPEPRCDDNKQEPVGGPLWLFNIDIS